MPPQEQEPTARRSSPQARAAVAQPQLPQRQDGPRPSDAAGQQAAAAGRGGGNFPWLTALGFGFLTFNSGMAVYRAQGDRSVIAFVAFSYLDLLALFVCLRMYETAEPGSALRHRLKVAVWLLTTALTAVFSYKVAAIMPAAVDVVVWLMAFATVAGGFYGFFCSPEMTLQPLLPQQQPSPSLAAGRHGGGFSWLTLLGFGFLTFNSGLAVYRAQGDRGAIAFVAFSHLGLLALFFCLRMYETADPGSALRYRLKVAVWLLTTALTAVFSYKVAAVMPAAVAFVVWLMAFATVAGGFYGFFCSTETTLLPQQQPGPSLLAAGRHGGGFSWLITFLGFCFLTLICGMAVYGSQGNGGAVAFVVFAYFDLLLLFYGMRPYDQAGDSHALRRRRAVWASTWTLTLLLCGMFAWGVAAVMPLPMAAVVYAMTATALLGVFCGFCADRG